MLWPHNTFTIVHNFKTYTFVCLHHISPAYNHMWLSDIVDLLSGSLHLSDWVHDTCCDTRVTIKELKDLKKLAKMAWLLQNICFYATFAFC